MSSIFRKSPLSASYTSIWKAAERVTNNCIKTLVCIKRAVLNHVGLLHILRLRLLYQNEMCGSHEVAFRGSGRSGTGPEGRREAQCVGDDGVNSRMQGSLSPKPLSHSHDGFFLRCPADKTCTWNGRSIKAESRDCHVRTSLEVESSHCLYLCASLVSYCSQRLELSWLA